MKYDDVQCTLCSMYTAGIIIMDSFVLDTDRFDRSKFPQSN